MKFVCDRCQTKYSIADERVRGKVLKVKCKTCANVITVREARRPSSAGFPTLSASAAAASRPRTGAHPPIDTSVETEERTQLAQSPFAPEQDAFPDLGALAPAHPPATRRRPTGQMAAIDSVDDHVQWYLALDGNRTGPFNRQKLVDKLTQLAKHADVHIWNERLGDWKPPAEVPAIASEISRRRAPQPPPLPGAPRRPTPPPMPPLGGLVPGQAGRKPTPHAPPSPVSHGSGGAASKLPPPGGVHPALAARGAHEHGGNPSSLLETPAPHMHPQHGHGPKTNGVGGAHAPPRPATSDVMQMLNMPGAAQSTPGEAPRLMSLSSTIAMGGGMVTPTPRSRSAVYILGLFAVVGVVVVLVVANLRKPPKPIAVVKPPDPVAEKVAAPEPPPPPAPVIEPTPPPPAPVKGGKRGGKQPHTLATKGQPAGTGTTPTPALPTGDAARFRDNHTLVINPGGGTTTRPPPAQADITKVISNNRASIKICYQRALTRDNSLTHGKLAVKLSIGISGRVKHVGLDGPTNFRTLLEPCIKDVVQRWVFPQASEEYGTEFPLVFQGNE